MNFFDAQERSFHKTRMLLLLMTAAVIAVVSCVTAVIAVTFWLTTSTTNGIMPFLLWAQANSNFILWTACGTTAFIGFASLYRIGSLSEGGSRVAQDLGGTAVTPDEQEPMRRRLRNVVEEMALASGVPVPKIYVLNHEGGINAFAAGFQPESAAIAVTRGTLETLDREELQGVIAHEFSHILNGDMRLNIHLMGPLFGILAIGLLGRMLLRSRTSGRHRSQGKGVAAAMVLGAGLTIIGYIGLLLGRLIKSGVSRQREYLADASAVQFTRQTKGIAGALKKIAGLTEGSSVQDTDVEEVSHMLFASGFSSLSGMLASHPPLLKRICAIEPTFSKTQLRQLKTERSNLNNTHPDKQNISGFATEAKPYTSSPNTPQYAPDELLNTIGNPTDSHITAAQSFMAGIPASISHALASQNEVLLLAPALLLHPDKTTQETQLNLLTQQLGTERSKTIKKLHTDLQALHFEARLPLLELALPRIKEHPCERVTYLADLLEQLATCDNQLELFEYALLRIFKGYMQASTGPTSKQRWINLGERKTITAATLLVNIYAHQTAANETEALQALQRGLTELGSAPAQMPAPENWIMAADQALLKLQNCTPKGRQHLIKALLATALNDGRITQAESELLRAFCMMLNCPIPPILGAH
ncbi:MAG: M48 family metallopeptidase [Gammaproteobacteria bacterium]|nr:M48 family metallopeptidase [Gammaproteobacteria bacterium]MCP4090074.1 M48 family metallopeptidase [Gammaproteobacteria bacterium]MCP4277036.1 M48 family metallopeptidase [Gammaproteobacteria bacterium]MCP4832741.1 M48 family metallopeptidase [Gammaproteobacteria bacterium]MCP4929934.1 M48 family metallopeptidase [Gammaproteobacteria bacterium]